MTDETGGPCGRKAFTTIGTTFNAITDEMIPGQPFCETHANQILEHAKRVVIRDADTSAKLKMAEDEARRRIRNLNKKREHFVYFAFNKDRVKIGYTTSPQRRLRNIENASGQPLTRSVIIEGNRNLEQKLHRMFDDARLVGEWFDVSPSLVDYVNQLEPCAEYQPFD